MRKSAQETPLAASPLGTTAGITESAAADVLAWRAAALAGENVVLVGTGNVDHDQLVAAAEALAPLVSYTAKPVQEDIGLT